MINRADTPGDAFREVIRHLRETRGMSMDEAIDWYRSSSGATRDRLTAAAQKRLLATRRVALGMPQFAAREPLRQPGGRR